MSLRLTVIMGAILGLFVYVGWRLALSFSTPLVVVIMIVFFVGIFVFRPLHRLPNRTLRKALLNLVYAEMGFLSFLLTWLFLRDLIFFPLSFARPQLGTLAYSSEGTFVVLGLATLSLFLGFVVAAAGPWIVRVNIPIKNLPADLEGFTIAQLSDMHIGPTTRPEKIARIVQRTLELKPSMIALTGDIGDGPVTESAASVENLRPLSQLPAFYVTGNHEYYWNAPAWIESISALGIKPLLNAFDVVKIKGSQLIVIGTPDPTARMLGADFAPDLARAVSTPLQNDGKQTEGAFKILLAHQPGISDQAENAGIDLQLSGHTHAGQFFPWTLVVKTVHRFYKGLGRSGRLWVYVNPGTGSWGPQIRLGTKTEITLLKLTKQS